MYKILLYIVIIFHFCILFGNTLAFFILPFKTQWYIACPICSYIVWMTFSRVADCPITKLENVLRRKLNYKLIGGFIGHYILKPLNILLHKNFSIFKPSKKQSQILPN